MTAPASPTPPPPAATDIELPACFYLGREYDLPSQKVLDRPVLYDARDLTTHGVVVGMTGSGKTGLCVSLLEEAALDGIPCILIDPKGDLGNLLLQFPDLKPEDFARWLNPEDARLKGVTLEDYGKQLADSWRLGLAEWGQTPERVARFRAASDFRVYTPGSEAGLPLSILQTFNAPQGATTREALNQKIDATTTALLGLTGIAADPVQSREHILIAQLLLHAWGKGRDLDLPQLITQIQVPPMTRIGAFDVDTFYPEKERLKLAIALNNILAAPSFSTWITGESLDLARMLYSPEGKPRQLVFHIAHLEDAQRMFFLTLLLEEVLSWTRKQPGTTSLRAILYFDEVFGYLPPHPANPPTKTPLMTLLKQARAFGVGVLLATQNPVDLDYKALSNAGTWFVGKLQTERDKARLVEGLEGVAAERGTLSDRNYLDNVISALGNRVFLLHNVHRGKPLLFKSRWALSFLRGPMTRDQIALLMEPLKQQLAQQGGPPSAIPLCPHCQAELGPDGVTCPHCGTGPEAGQQPEAEFKEQLRRHAQPGPAEHTPDTAAPALPQDVRQYYLPGPTGSAGGVTYRPRVLGCAEVTFADKRKGLEFHRTYRLVAEAAPPGEAIAWYAAEPLTADPAPGPVPGARWGAVPDSLNTARKLKALEKGFVEFLHDSAQLAVLTNRALELVGHPGEDVVAFQARCREAACRAADNALSEERARYQARFAELGASLPEDPRADRDAGTAPGGLDWFWNPLGALFGSPPPRPPARASKAQAKLAKLESEWHQKRARLLEEWRRRGEEYGEIRLTPRKADVRVTHFGLAWDPGSGTP